MAAVLFNRLALARYLLGAGPDVSHRLTQFVHHDSQRVNDGPFDASTGQPDVEMSIGHLGHGLCDLCRFGAQTPCQQTHQRQRHQQPHQHDRSKSHHGAPLQTLHAADHGLHPAFHLARLQRSKRKQGSQVLSLGFAQAASEHAASGSAGAALQLMHVVFGQCCKTFGTGLNREQ